MGGDLPSSTTAGLLQRFLDGDLRAQDELYERVRAELHDCAARWMRKQHAGHTLQTTALVNEAWLKLMGGSPTTCNGREHFVRLAARAMRSVLVDHARARATAKRGVREQCESIEELAISIDRPGDDLLALDEALVRLAQIDARVVKVAELKLFGGLEHEEIARNLDVSTRTVERAWKSARVWLRHELGQRVT